VSKKWSVGLKNLKDLICGELNSRLTTESAKKFEISQSNLLTTIQSKLRETMDSSKEKLDLQKQIESLNTLAKDFKQPDLMIDCICFHDGKTWQGAIDPSGTGDFTSSPLMSSYHDQYQFARLDISSLMNYSFNIYDSGSILSIVTTAGSHGTHVASIASAFHNQDSELNGVSPSSQIVSLKIGDTRLGSMETGRGLMRALNELLRLKVDIANISYGEAISVHQGRFIEQIRKVVNQGCIVVSSGGN
jgi:tripeptidyl-peptidase II